MEPERRNFPRIQIDTHIRVGASNKKDLFDTRIRDLSLSGVYIFMKKTRPIGTQLYLEFEINDENTAFAIKGLIVHELSAKDTSGKERSGIGVIFLDTDEKVRTKLQTLIDFEQKA